jgi:hypothetical protein
LLLLSLQKAVLQSKLEPVLLLYSDSSWWPTHLKLVGKYYLFFWWFNMYCKQECRGTVVTLLTRCYTHNWITTAPGGACPAGTSQCDTCQTSFRRSNNLFDLFYLGKLKVTEWVFSPCFPQCHFKAQKQKLLCVTFDVGKVRSDKKLFNLWKLPVIIDLCNLPCC